MLLKFDINRTVQAKWEYKYVPSPSPNDMDIGNLMNDIMYYIQNMSLPIFEYFKHLTKSNANFLMAKPKPYKESIQVLIIW